ncbi:C10 family peptidase [Capnocytophaga sp. HP1101]
MKKHLLIFTFAGLFFSCQREEADAPFATDTDISVLPSTETNASDNGLLGWVALTGQTHISAEEAQETALATAMQMREVEGIVTKAPLQIGSVEVVKGNTRKPYVPTKGGSKPEQADVYIINFANNQGYVVTSGDRRVPGVLAYNSYGQLSDTITNPGQAILFSYMQAYIEEQREAFEANKEKLATEAEEAIFKQLSKERQAELIAQGLFDKEGKRVKTKDRPIKPAYCIDFDDLGGNNSGDYEYDYTTYGEFQTKLIKAPLIKTLWGQSGDYNDKVTKYCDADRDQSAVGCVATALGQLMAYHKKPTVFKGRTMHWDDMTKIDNGHMFSNMDSYSIWSNPTAKEDIQYLLAHLGDSDLLAMTYGCRADGGSGSGRALEALHALGYNNSSLVPYNATQLVSEIENNRPIYIQGYSYQIPHSYTTGWWFWKKSCTRYSYDKGHAWVIDGYVLKTREVKHYTKCPKMEGYTNISYDKLELVHNNFGWEGNLNGSDFKWNKEDYDGTGWYNINVFNAKSGREAGSNTYKSGAEGDYKFEKTLIINIK